MLKSATSVSWSCPSTATSTGCSEDLWYCKTGGSEGGGEMEGGREKKTLNIPVRPLSFSLLTE